MSETRVRLRAITEEDLPDYVIWLNDPEVTEFTTLESGSITLEGEREWLARITAPDEGSRHWAIELDGRHVGNCALMPDPAGLTAGFGIIIGDKSAWNKGYGTAALREVMRIGFEEMGLHRIHLEVMAENARAIRCYEKAGFRAEGVLHKSFHVDGAWQDDVLMAILREEWQAGIAPGTGLLQSVGQELASCPGDLRVRSYRPADYPAMMALWEACGWEPGLNDTDEMLRQRAADPRGFIVAAERDGTLVGTVMGHMDRGWGWIQRLAVHPEHRRQGLGRYLTQQAEKRLKALGAYRLVLLTRRDSAAAVGLYQSLGYETWEPVIVMSKRLIQREEECCGHERAGDSR